MTQFHFGILGKMNLGFFLEHLNTYVRNLQFTIEIEIVHKISLLDALIIHSIDKLNFTIYIKPTQNIGYLHLNKTIHKI